jgi:hypothetical protein
MFFRRIHSSYLPKAKGMFWLVPALTVCAGAVVLVFTMAHSGQAQTTGTSTLQTVTQLSQALMSLLPELPIDPTTDPPGNFSNVIPRQFDPGKTNLVQASWLTGIGCPTGATIAIPNASFTGVDSFTTYTDPACLKGDSSDQRNQGLLLAKTGPTPNFAAAVADLINVKGITLSELGYDIRKFGPGTHSGPQGSHCGAGAPRFNILTTTNFYFLACSSPPPDAEGDGEGWIRLRWGISGTVSAFCPTCPFPMNQTPQAITGTVQRIQIVFDEGYLTPSMPSVGPFPNTGGGPDEFGAAILDNIDVNGTLVGRGPVSAN